MPLKKGKSRSAFEGNIRELIRTYKKKGKIGNVTPKSMAHARKIALAIAYDKRRGK